MNQGRDIPGDYNEWKARIILIRPPHKNSTTATSNPKAGGTTSSSTPKAPSSAANPGRDSSGRWTTFGGAGKPMDIDVAKLRAEGRCFRCHEKGHMGKDCPKKKDYRDIRSVQATNEPVTESKVEEDLHTGTSSNPTCIQRTNILSTHSNIPRLRAPAFNVSSTTSTPVTESQNRYTALSVEECNDDNDIPLKGCTDASPARAEAKAVKPAGHEAESLPTLPKLTCRQTGAKRPTSNLRGETQPVKVSDKKSPTIVTPIDTASLPRRTDGTQAESRDSTCEVSSPHEQAAQTFRSAITTADVESQLDGETTASLPGQERGTRNEEATAHPALTKAQTTNSKEYEGCCSPRVGDKKARTGNSDGQGETGNSTFAVQAHPARGGLPSTRDGDRSIPPLKEQGSAKVQKRPAAGQDSASAQAVKRGHSVDTPSMRSHLDFVIL
ncbi:uncharacterized protein ARMOST_20084 [Armillaria ostoyae]|uniref:CCHC-type domain-containing protein n=1 Tax=Armillaria ostoyae TaxID=47428 RepID=A0A284S6C9_ARMOS|nr:uncharacterized protein ARMOST_20084 [Armillaria ostoyae]